MNTNKTELRDFYLLWSTQSLSQLGSAVTGFALTLWLYEKTGSALSTAMLTICTYAPYVVMSIFAGAITDRFDKKRTMLACDTFAAACTVLVLVLYRTGLLRMWHLYAVNAVSGLMNTVQQPASEVAYTLVVPKEYYQKTSGLQSLSRSLISSGNPLIAAAVYGMAGLEAVILLDLMTFAVAFLALFCLIRIPVVRAGTGKNENVLMLAGEGLAFLKMNPLILHVILFMSGVNLIASSFDAVLPALVIPRCGSGVLGIVTSCSGIAMVLGSLLVTVMKKPRDRVKVIYRTMLFSLGIENFVLAFRGILSGGAPGRSWAGSWCLSWAPIRTSSCGTRSRWNCRGGCTRAGIPFSSSRSRWGWRWAGSWWMRSASLSWLPGRRAQRLCCSSEAAKGPGRR